jgi:hypothetical protein
MIVLIDNQFLAAIRYDKFILHLIHAKTVDAYSKRTAIS